MWGAAPGGMHAPPSSDGGGAPGPGADLDWPPGSAGIPFPQRDAPPPDLHPDHPSAPEPQVRTHPSQGFPPGQPSHPGQGLPPGPARREPQGYNPGTGYLSAPGYDTGPGYPPAESYNSGTAAFAPAPASEPGRGYTRRPHQADGGQAGSARRL